jgi:hypothetical protein
MICLPYQLFCNASISFQSHFISCILHSALLMSTAQVAAASDITEIKCTTLKNCYQVFSHTLSVRLLIVQPISCSKHVTSLRNCSCIVVSSFLGVHLPLGCSQNKATVWKRQLSSTQCPTSSSHCKVHADHVLVTWMKMCITNSFLRQKSWTNISVQMNYTYSYVLRKLPENWPIGDGLLHHDNAAVNSALSVQIFQPIRPQQLPHTLQAPMSAYIFLFSKTLSHGGGKEISWHQHDQEQLQAILAQLWTQKLGDASNSDSRIGLAASSLGNTLQATPSLKKCGHRCGGTKKIVSDTTITHQSFLCRY